LFHFPPENRPSKVKRREIILVKKISVISSQANPRICGLYLAAVFINPIIFNLYLKGKSLGGIADALKERGIPSPTGKPVWGRAAIDDILSKGKYVPLIISEEKFYEAQFEKNRRSNTNDNRTRKTARKR